MVGLFEFILGHASLYIGPFFATALVQMVQQGIIFEQMIKYCCLSSRRHYFFIRSAVVFTFFVALFQTGAAFFNNWRIFVFNFTLPTAAINFRWPDEIQPILTATIAAPVQLYLIWRTWIIMGKRTVVVFPMLALLMVAYSAAIVVTAQIFLTTFNITTDTTNFTTDGPPLSPKGTPGSQAFLVWLYATATLDICLTIAVFRSIIRAEMKLMNDNLHPFFQLLCLFFNVLWQTAIPSSMSALIAAVMFIASSKVGTWFFFFQEITGKFYIITLLLSVNSKGLDSEHGISPSAAGSRGQTSTKPSELAVSSMHTGLSSQRQVGDDYSVPARIWGVSRRFPEDVQEEYPLGGGFEAS